MNYKIIKIEQYYSMKLELIIFAVTAFFIVNTYYDGKYVQIMKSWKKYYQMIMIGFLVCVRRMLCPPTQQIVHEHRVIVQPNRVVQNPISYIVVQEPENHYSIGVPVTFVKNPIRGTSTL